MYNTLSLILYVYVTLNVFPASVLMDLLGFYALLKFCYYQKLIFLFYRKACALENYPQDQKMENGRIKQYWIITDTS